MLLIASTFLTEAHQYYRGYCPIFKYILTETKFLEISRGTPCLFVFAIRLQILIENGELFHFFEQFD